MTACRNIVIVALALLFASEASADIGGVGSPVTVSNPTPAPAAAAATPAAAAATPAAAAAPALPPTAAPQKPLLVIRFNQKHVSFQQAVRQAVTSAEHAKGGVVYSVVSYVPAGNSPSQNERNAQEADTNLKAVLGEMVSDGVSASRIGTNSLTAPAGGSQEVHIYVQ